LSSRIIYLVNEFINSCSRPIYARFYLMDGTYHAVEFQASASAHDVMEVLKNKVGLEESAKGDYYYYYYESVLLYKRFSH